MAKKLSDILKKLPKAQQAKVEARAKKLKSETTKVPADPARYVVVKRTVETEECYSVVAGTCNIERVELLKGLENGDLNLVQSATVESYVWIVNAQGQRVGALEKDGGCGPDHKVTIEVSGYSTPKV